MPSQTRGSISPSRRRALALWVVLAAQLMLAMDFLIVVVALPRIQQDLGFTSAGLTWVPNAFGLAFGGLLLLGGRLGDIVGQVRAFRIGLIVFVVSSLVGGLAPLPSVLIAARVVQGIGAALAAPSVLALVMVMARDEAEKARGLSLFTAVSSIGASAGLILGGVLTDFLSWRWALLINVPVGILVATAIGRLVDETRPKAGRLDVAGALTATIGSVALVYGFISAADNGWATTGTLVSFVGAIILAVIFFQVEKRHAAPLLDLNLVQDRARLSGLAVMALIVGVHFAVLFMLVQYPPARAGLDAAWRGPGLYAVDDNRLCDQRVRTSYDCKIWCPCIAPYRERDRRDQPDRICFTGRRQPLFPRRADPLADPCGGYRVHLRSGHGRDHAWRSGRARRHRFRTAADGSADWRGARDCRHYVNLCFCRGPGPICFGSTGSVCRRSCHRGPSGAYCRAECRFNSRSPASPSCHGILSVSWESRCRTAAIDQATVA